MRVELNHQSAFEDYEGEVQLLRPSRIKEVLTELFSQKPYSLVKIENDGSLYSINYENNINQEEYNINVFYGNIRNESRNNREKKIQLNGKDPRNLEKSIILGCYCYQNGDNLENLIFVGWNIDENTNYPSNPSLRGLNVDILQKARFYGFYRHEYRSNYICAFLPSLIFYYINNYENIHVSSFLIENDSAIVDEQINGFNKIYFGPPGTGKSHAIKEELKAKGVKPDNYSRVTFHPDYDYSSFVGGYRPYTDESDNGKIKYNFVSQVFIDLYVKAWENVSEHYYLIIEEINRGNCAEIFGDIFQLLDRNPEYNIEPSSELKKYLENVENTKNVDLLFNGKLQMPPNLSILASMNTSDQSLYPMDSAFKRRWEWEYVPIDTECKDSNFVIEIDEDHKYSWLLFLEAVNERIYSVTKSEDKQLGNWFINVAEDEYKEEEIRGYISKDLFINKALFYLWNDIFKDEVYHPENIFVEKNEKGEKVKDISFNDFYKKGEQEKLLIHLFENILDLKKPPHKILSTEPDIINNDEELSENKEHIE